MSTSIGVMTLLLIALGWLLWYRHKTRYHIVAFGVSKTRDPEAMTLIECNRSRRWRRTILEEIPREKYEIEAARGTFILDADMIIELTGHRRAVDYFSRLIARDADTIHRKSEIEKQ